MTPEQKARNFLQTADLYKLGDLVTESRHLLTTHLSQWAKDDLPKAIAALAQVDRQALSVFAGKRDGLAALREVAQKTLADGHTIYLVGCGATGRLSLTIESLWKEKFPKDERVRSFMAGGDMALVHSLEGFEDYPEYGARQLLQMGFQPGDLLIGSSEGGETPYVIGAVEKAAEVSPKNPPWFLYCNPDEILRDRVERSRKVIGNPGIRKLNLSVGPMALSGSTRMQASTVLQLAVGLAVLPDEDLSVFESRLKELSEIVDGNAELFLRPFIERESQVYAEKNYIMYVPQSHIITIFTDTTERAPTFSLTSFSHPKAEALLKRPPSLCYVMIAEAVDGADAWKRLLQRPPRSLNWQEVDVRTADDYRNAFDFGPAAQAFRQKLIAPAQQEQFHINFDKGGFFWRLMDHEAHLRVPEDWSPLWQHTLLKQLLNIHSTLIMGRLGRYKNNVMTWVYPTNGKLIDRATRYVQGLLADAGKKVPYETAVEELFRQFETLNTNESIVLKTVAALSEAASTRH